MNIAVDMTPYIHGGANGGIVPLTAATIEELVDRSGHEIILLTSSGNHDSLAFMEKPNITRCCVLQVAMEPQPAPAVSLKRRIYLRIRGYLVKAAPRGLLLWLKRHQDFFRKIKHMILHPVQDIVKPAAKRMLPRSIVQRIYQKKAARRAVPDTTPQVDLTAILGRPVDILYCPFTAINFMDPSVPVVSVLNDIQHKYCPWFFDESEIVNREHFYQALIALCPNIISISEFTRRTFLETYHYPADRVVTIYPAVQNRLSRFSADDPQRLEKCGVEKENFILYPANFWPHKNHRGLLTAFGMYCHRHPESDLKLALTGFSTSGNSDWREMTERMGLADRVLHLGYVSDAELAALFRSCCFMIFPSLFEGFGMPVTEAMAMDTTVLCSNVTSLPEIGGDCVFYFGPYDPADICRQMEYVLTHPEEAEAKRAVYAEHLNAFSTDVYIQKLDQLFERLTAKEGAQE